MLYEQYKQLRMHAAVKTAKQNYFNTTPQILQHPTAKHNTKFVLHHNEPNIYRTQGSTFEQIPIFEITSKLGGSSCEICNSKFTARNLQLKTRASKFEALDFALYVLTLGGPEVSQ